MESVKVGVEVVTLLVLALGMASMFFRYFLW
jgi:hypothetical protein